MFGGHIEPGEQPQQTLIRELQEELGITPTHWLDLDVLTDVSADRDEEVLCYVYLVAAWNGTPTNLQPSEHTAIAWFALDQAVQLELAHPDYPQLFARALASTTAS
jgi:8-oxo-dGTP pyrophosphatase MutT (NUDIX family)